jgi:hypothetical protein
MLCLNHKHTFLSSLHLLLSGMLLIAACPPTLPNYRTVVLYRDLASMFIATSPYPHVPFFSLSSAVQHVMLQMMSDIFLHHSNFLSDPKIQKFY